MKRSDVFLRKSGLPKYRQQSLIVVSSYDGKRIVAKVSMTHTAKIGEYTPQEKGKQHA